jgi:ATP-binding cassette subfamily F protein uup
LIVSHDRYFMDRLVDHLLVLEGNGIIRDFPGNYTQYREWQRNNDDEAAFPNEQPAAKTAETTIPSSTSTTTAKKQLSYKEKREFEILEQDIARLTREKQEVTAQLNSGAVPFDQLQALSIRIGEIGQMLDDKEMRWLQLSEIGG